MATGIQPQRVEPEQVRTQLEMNEHIPADELIQQIDNEIADIQEKQEAFEERVALQAPDDGKTTQQRCLEGLQRQERFPGEHNALRAWLRSSKSIGAIFTKSAR